jgi:predicted AAA+ superfamily ATPase
MLNLIPVFLSFFVKFAGIIDNNMLFRNLEDDILFGMSFQPAVALVGLRQVGKTTLAKKLLLEAGKQAVYFDLEDTRDLQKFQFDPAGFLETLQDKTVILDEVQRFPELFPALRGLIDRNRVPGRFVLLGSASFELLKSTSESLAGRISYFELRPFLLKELNANDQKMHWLRGGIPNSFLAPSDLIQQKWMEDYIRTYLERDLPQLGLNANPVLIRRLLTMIAGIQGNLLNQNMLATSLGIRNNSLSSHLDFMENAFFIRRLQPYFANIGKRLTKSPKLYIRDSGILNHLLGLHSYEAQLSHISSGGSFEGYVIEQVLDCLKPTQSAYFYRTADGAELDLVIESAGKIALAIEIKLSNNPVLTRGTTTALEDLGNPPLLVVTPDVDDLPLNRKAQVCSVVSLPQKLSSILNT